MKFRYNAGEFKHPIKFLKKEKAISSLKDDTFNIFFECRAKVKKATGVERENENNIIAKKEINIIIRYPKGIEITESDVFEFKNKNFNIKFLNNTEELDVYLEIKGVEM